MAQNNNEKLIKTLSERYGKDMIERLFDTELNDYCDLDDSVKPNGSCDHSDVCQDERCCLDCGKDMTEELACGTEYRRDTMEDK